MQTKRVLLLCQNLFNHYVTLNNNNHSADNDDALSFSYDDDDDDIGVQADDAASAPPAVETEKVAPAPAVVVEQPRSGSTRDQQHKEHTHRTTLGKRDRQRRDERRGRVHPIRHGIVRPCETCKPHV